MKNVTVIRQVDVVDEKEFEKFKNDISNQMFNKVGRDSFREYQIGMNTSLGNLGKQIAEANNKVNKVKEEIESSKKAREIRDKFDSEWLGKWVKRYIDLEDRIKALEEKLAGKEKADD